MEEQAAQNGNRLKHSVEAGRFPCLECSQTFGRVEHLTRHSRSHMKEHFLKCSHCRKGFYRIDALRRHEQIHKEPKRSLLGKGARACLPCAAARRKCSGETPCSGCSKRSTECKYPDTGRSKKAPNGEFSNGNSHSPRHDHSRADQDMANTQDPPTSWSNESTSGKESQGEDNLCSIIPVTSTNILSQGSRSAEFPTGYPICYVAGIGVHSQIPPESLESPRRPSASLQPMIVNPAAQNTENVWYQNTFSSINWLPDDWTPDFQVGGGDGLGSFDQGTSLVFGQTPQPSPGTYPEVPGINHSVPRSSRPRVDPPRLPPQFVEGQEISSPGSHESTHSGHFYVDGDGARLPRVRKAPYRYSEAHAHAPLPNRQDSYLVFMFPEHADADGNSIEVPRSVYSELFQIFDLTCINSTHFENFHSAAFPSRKLLSRLVWLYKDNFQSTLPFIHPSTFDITTSHWLLTLALVAAGSHYLEIDSSDLLVVSMHEFLRRAIQTVIETGGNSIPNPLLLIQVKLLNSVGMMYCGDERLKKISQGYQSSFVSFIDTEWMIKPREILRVPINDPEKLAQDWSSWAEGESTRRTGYCIWLLDCMWAFHFQMRPLLSLEDAKIPIPCQEVLWEAETALDWQQLFACATPSPSLHSAIQIAYIEKRLQSSMGEFSRILCIHALFRRTWEVESYFKQPLTLWKPTAEKQDISTVSSSTPIWLPGIPTYAKWRNSACDCLDILHWHANSVIGAASGMEHPTVLHLHLARIILLTPYQKIMHLAMLLTSDPTTTSKSQHKQLISKTKQHIKRWVLEDQHKARLAMIHAGVLFWHVRHYSTDAFYEPSSVFLATLALWAYGTFAAHTSPLRPQTVSQPQSNLLDQAQNAETPKTSPSIYTTNPDPDPDEDADADSLFPTSMQLDRPADDELVQLFVKRGASMRANITGVGNLCSVKGPVRILGEGRNLLAGLRAWGDRRRAVGVLGGLIEVCRSEG